MSKEAVNNQIWDKSKGLPQQAEVTQGVLGRLMPRIFLTFRHYDGGRSSALRTGRLYPRRNPWYSFSGAESTPGQMVLSGGRGHGKKYPVTLLGIDPGTSRLVAQCLNHYAIPGPKMWDTTLKLSRKDWGNSRTISTWFTYLVSLDLSIV